MDRLNINWLREALNFFAALHPVKKQRDLNAIYKGSTELIMKHAHANGAALIHSEDKITARVLYSTANFLSGFIDADLINRLVDGGKIEVTDGSGISKSTDATSIFIPVEEKSFCGVFVLHYNQTFDAPDDFREFLAHARIGLQEATISIQTYYAIEQLSTRFNAILGTIPEGIVFVDDRGKQGWVNGIAAKLLNLDEATNTPVAISTAMQQLRNTAVNQESIMRDGMKLFSSPDQTIKNWEWIFGSPAKQVLHVTCVPAIVRQCEG